MPDSTKSPSNVLNVIEEGLSDTKNYLTNLGEVLGERIKSPLLFSFTIFWIIFHWELFLYFFFSQANIESKIIQMQDYLKDYTALVWAIGLSIIYTFGYPYEIPINWWDEDQSEISDSPIKKFI